MLNELIDGTLNPRLAAITPTMIETLGGLTQSITRFVETADGPIRQSFPVTFKQDGVSAFRNGAYNALCPDTAKKSLAYWSYTGSTPQQAQNPRMRAVRYGARFAFWANMPAFGHTPGHMPFAMVEKIRKTLEGRYTLAEPYERATAEVKAISLNFENPIVVFGQHTFADDQRLFMWPHAYFGILFDITVTYDPECMPDYQPDNPITCTII